MISKTEITDRNFSLPGDYPASSRDRGKHKIFVGMCPGVGKTYQMLEEAHQLKEEGIDVVIGLLETHGREETVKKAVGLEEIPKQTIVHQGITLWEMHTDAILSRKPQLVLVDELAHTNVPGSSREKRYQDVEVILNHGINVYSTVNIQHLESLNDIVAKITKVVVRERIPDRILDEATQVVVIDVTPETLQERLKEGKIYTPDKIEKSLQNFFQRRHLVALRELALREVANNIEESAENREKTLFCNVHERVLVCFSTYQNSPRLVRRGLRLANFMKARLYGLYVENPERFLTKEESLVLETCQHLIQEFGGEFIRIKTHNVAEGIAEISQQYHITQIVLGHTRKSRWELILKGSLINQLLKYLKGVDIHIIDGEKT